ncbi:FecR domain-containing protein, partial [Candidatus Peregrinibacteria bacterium]|nr:FecR domain-containing protein [Candidatus Peregrinibacteria bacterium]
MALITLGVFIILAFQLWGSFFPNAKGDAVFYLAEGRSKVLGFGTSEWENVYNGSKIKLGDSVKTLGNAKGVIQFYDGTVVRLDESTQVTLLDISKKDDYQEILLFLNSGKIWVNKPKQNVIRKTDFVINSNYASYAITGTVFDLEKNDEEVLHVMRGQVQVDILENADGKMRTIESIPVGIGQQTTLSEAVMKEFYERKSPSVLGATDISFEDTDWYKWNVAEDDDPTDFSKTHGSTSITSDSESTPELGDAAISADTGEVKKASTLEPPSLTSPKSKQITTTSDKLSLSGKAS